MKTKEERAAHLREYRKRKRRERGLQKQGRKPNTPEQQAEAKENRKQWEKGYISSYSLKHPARRLLWTARARAKRKGIEFTIELEDVVIPLECPYLQIPLIPHAQRGTSRTQVLSLDRIDPTKGYIKGNVEVISWLANTMKNNASPEQLVSFAKTVLSRYENSGL